jgi:GTP-binding protein
LFHSARFVLSVAEPPGLPPPTLPEIAFAGRSNAGKSTAINVLTGQKRLAFASKTPGRTQLLNFFELSERASSGEHLARAFLVDLPGYGYAKVPATERARWDALVGSYVAQRTTLVGVVVVMDARRPFTSSDETLIEYVRRPHRGMHFLLTKADQLKRSEQRAALAHAQQRVADLGPRASAQLFSALKREGVDELKQVLSSWIRH